jgi:hypothetical protein
LLSILQKFKPSNINIVLSSGGGGKLVHWTKMPVTLVIL